jgi:competence protein ComEA
MGAVESLERRSRVRVAIGAAVVLLVVALGCAVLFSAIAPTGESTVIAPSAAPAVRVGIFVHVLGEVTAPGLYELSEGDRAVDAIAAAGGFTKEADEAQLNLARFVTDGEQLIVPAMGAGPPVSPGVPGKINLNTADLAELETLPRIGPAMAARILEWRDTNGRFSSVDDLKSVTGVGEKTFDALKDLVTI